MPEKIFHIPDKGLDPNPLQSRPLGACTHLAHQTFHCWKHLLKSSFGMVFISAVAFRIISSLLSKLDPFSGVFNFGNNQTWLLATSSWLVGWILWHVNPCWVILCQRRFCFIHPFGYLGFFSLFLRTQFFYELKFYELNFFMNSFNP